MTSTSALSSADAPTGVVVIDGAELETVVAGVSVSLSMEATSTLPEVGEDVCS